MDAEGQDIYFQGGSLDLPGGPLIKLEREIEHYDGDSGELVAWVRIPLLAPAPAQTTIYICFGDAQTMAPPRNTRVWDEHYMAVWHLGEKGHGLEDEYQDSTSNGNHGQGGNTMSQSNQDNIDSTPTVVAGKMGFGQKFDGSDDYISAPSHDETLGMNDAVEMTMEAWVLNEPDPEAPNHSGGIISKGGDTSGYCLYAGDGSEAFDSNVHYCSKAPGQEHDGIVSKASITLDQWQHVLVTFNQGTLTFFINGSLDSTVPEAGAPAITSSDGSELKIGLSDVDIIDGNAYHFAGKIDGVRISNVARTADWIKTQYDNITEPNFYTISP